MAQVKTAKRSGLKRIGQLVRSVLAMVYGAIIREVGMLSSWRSVDVVRNAKEYIRWLCSMMRKCASFCPFGPLGIGYGARLTVVEVNSVV
jgi:hypothetical protein